MNYKEILIHKISQNREVIVIIGLGYVGLPLAVGFAQAGLQVIGFDKSTDKVNKINQGDNYIKDIRDAVLREVVDSIKLTASMVFTVVDPPVGPSERTKPKQGMIVMMWIFLEAMIGIGFIFAREYRDNLVEKWQAS
jgi:nucleoside-diphosphate-sugar epimerase